MERVYNTRRSYSISGTDLLVDLAKKVDNLSELFLECFQNISHVAYFEETIFTAWKDLCAQDFFDVNYSVDDLIFKGRDASFVVSREDIKVSEEVTA